jgi:hypothetical protein
MTVLDRYFELSDRASFDEAAFKELVDLFAEQAEVQPAGGSKVTGREAIENLYTMFFQMYDKIQHVWSTQKTENGLEATWAIAGCHKDGNLFTVQGIHFAQLDTEGKIRALEVRLATSNS